MSIKTQCAVEHVKVTNRGNQWYSNTIIQIFIVSQRLFTAWQYLRFHKLICPGMQIIKATTCCLRHNVFLQLSNLCIFNYNFNTNLKDEKFSSLFILSDNLQYANIDYHLCFQLNDPVSCECKHCLIWWQTYFPIKGIHCRLFEWIDFQVQAAQWAHGYIQ